MSENSPQGDGKTTRQRRGPGFRTRATAFLLAILLGIGSLVCIVSLSNNLTASYTATDGKVLSTETKTRSRINRKQRHRKKRYYSTIEYQLNGVTRTDRVKSGSLMKGITVPVWVQDNTGDVHFHKPKPPEFGHWLLAFAMPVASLYFLRMTFRRGRLVRQ